MSINKEITTTINFRATISQERYIESLIKKDIKNKSEALRKIIKEHKELTKNKCL